MNKKLIILSLLLLCACKKKEPGTFSDPIQSVRGNCNYTTSMQSGAIDPIPNNDQHIPTTVWPIREPLNYLNVSICKADNTCLTTPSVYIAYGLNTPEVILHHAFDVGYVTWNILEATCQ